MAQQVGDCYHRPDSLLGEAVSSLFEELKRRNVIRMAVAYAVVSWLIIQVADTAVPALRLPEWVTSLVFLLLALGLVPVLVFAWAFELTPEGLKREKDVDRSRSITTETGRKLNYVTLAALALVVLLVAADRMFAPQPAASTARPATSAADVSIAVLPFTDMSPNGDQEYFSDGITEEILNGLAKLRKLKVAGRTSSFAFKGRNEDLREIGAALGVQHVLEGSVRKDGDRLRITAQLISVDDGFHLWSETYDRELRDVFQVQDEISAAIVGELRGSLLSEVAVSGSTGGGEIDVAVYEKYLAARKQIGLRTNESLTTARAVLEEIVAAEPDFAPGLTALAETVVLLVNEGALSSYGNLDPEEMRATAGPLLNRALDLDPTLADAYAVRGLLYYHDRDWERATESLQKAVELNPSLSNAWNWLANVASARGQIDQSIGYLGEATEIDPLWLVPNSNLIYRYQEKGEHDSVNAILDRLRPFHAESAFFHATDARVKRETGRFAEALKAAREAARLSPNTPGIAGETVFVLLGLQEFRQALDAMPGVDLSLARAFVTGDWSEVLPGMRERLAEDLSSEPGLGFYITGAGYSGDFGGLAAFYDAHIRDPAVLVQTDFCGPCPKLAIALQKVGRNADARELLAAAHATLLERDAAGYKGIEQDVRWAEYLALTGDRDGAMDRLESAFDRGMRSAWWRYSLGWEALRDEPRFKTIQQRNLEAINAERMKLGWDPVPEVGILLDPAIL